MQALSLWNDKIILKFDAISALVRNIACLLQNRVDRSIDAEKPKSEDLAGLINGYECAVEKTIMDKVADSIDKNEVVKLPDNFKPPTILSGEEIKKENQKECKNFKDTSLIINSKDFKITKNIAEGEKKNYSKNMAEGEKKTIQDHRWPKWRSTDWHPDSYWWLESSG